MDSSTGAPSFEQHVHDRHAALLRAARRLATDQYEAEDLLQTALMLTYQQWNNIKHKQATDSYIWRTMYNLRTERWRARRLDEVPTEQLPDTSTPDIADQYVNRRLLISVLAQLPPQQQRVVILRHLEQHSTQETAEVVGVAAGTVKSTLHRALLQLRSNLHSCDTDTTPRP